MNYDFSRQISGIIKRTNIRIQDALERITLDISSRIIEKTPVAVGTLRGNWMPAYDHIDFATDDTITEAGLNSASTARVAASVNGAKLVGKVWYLTNSMPYAYRIEYEGWSHTKAPRGMVRVSVTEVRNEMNRLIRGV